MEPNTALNSKHRSTAKRRNSGLITIKLLNNRLKPAQPVVWILQHWNQNPQPLGGIQQSGQFHPTLTARAPLRDNTKVAKAELRFNACPVLGQLGHGRSVAPTAEA